MKAAVLIGGGGHAKVVAALVEKAGAYRLLGYTALTRGNLSLSYLGGDELLSGLVADEAQAAILGIGIMAVDDSRQELHRRVMGYGFEFPSIISPNAVVNRDVTVGDGTVVMDGAVVNPGTAIGICSIVNTNATVEHDCTLGSFAHVAPGAVLCGGVSVGDRSIIGARACVLPGRKIGDRCMVGAGATVTRDLIEPGIYIGSPAKKRAAI